MWPREWGFVDLGTPEPSSGLDASAMEVNERGHVLARTWPHSGGSGGAFYLWRDGTWTRIFGIDPANGTSTWIAGRSHSLRDKDQVLLRVTSDIALVRS